MPNLILSALLLASAFQTALGEQDGDWTYYVENNKAAITGYTGAGGAVIIPSEFGGYPVVRIDSDRLHPPPFFSEESRASVTSLTIPDSLTIISCLLDGCTALTSITVAASNQFYSSDVYGVLFNKDKTTILAYPPGRIGAYTIPNTVTKVELGKFGLCSGLTSLTIPESVTSMGMYAIFQGCTALTSITVAASNQFYSSDVYGVLFNKDKTTILAYPPGRIGAYTIPDSVTIVGSPFVGAPGAAMPFYLCTNLTGVTIPNTVTNIGHHSFAGCTGLTSLTIPESVTSIDQIAFYGCTNLQKAYFLGDCPASQFFEFEATPATIFYLSGRMGWGSAFGGRPTQMMTAKDVIDAPNIYNLYTATQYNANFTAGENSILNSPNSNGLYTTSQIQNMAVGDLVLTKNVGGTFTLNYDIEQSADLQTWTPYQALSLPLTRLPADKAFVRIKVLNSTPNPPYSPPTDPSATPVGSNL